jgi:hypothetical protein
VGDYWSIHVGGYRYVAVWALHIHARRLSYVYLHAHMVRTIDDVFKSKMPYAYAYTHTVFSSSSVKCVPQAGVSQARCLCHPLQKHLRLWRLHARMSVWGLHGEARSHTFRRPSSRGGLRRCLDIRKSSVAVVFRGVELVKMQV